MRVSSCIWKICFLIINHTALSFYTDKDEEPKTKTTKETKWDWELLNDVKAVWLRNPKDVTAEEYDKFYHSLAKVCVQVIPAVFPSFWVPLSVIVLQWPPAVKGAELWDGNLCALMSLE